MHIEGLFSNKVEVTIISIFHEAFWSFRLRNTLTPAVIAKRVWADLARLLHIVSYIARDISQAAALGATVAVTALEAESRDGPHRG